MEIIDVETDPIEELTYKVDVLTWLYAELMYRVRLATAQQLVSRPDIQQRLQELIANKLTL
ncbi:MAG: hypothetical protein A4E20_10900 [Nitrospira sp. SG-bin2]|uniref:hypothetical protein n=1 Tax=Nitrospira cf. moscoviensis SBR1015 TaxID=96242 RepID=UPI000A0D2857|nr:hypothetical protein [Nitrospira cf. moscoviensis SBR1015]OQW34520.1 MAG: hypothetical protein A4E20_10900 [Nitrospira sp. SG-bin2]